MVKKLKIQKLTTIFKIFNQKTPKLEKLAPISVFFLILTHHKKLK